MTVTPTSLRRIAGQLERDATYCEAQGWPGIAQHNLAVAHQLTTAANILERDNGATQERQA